MRSRRALVTRPREDAAGIAAELAARGYEVQLEPLMRIENRRDGPLPLTGVQGLVATSANGVRALVAPADRADPALTGLPLWAVGEATARAARDAGFTRVGVAGGNVGRLVDLIRERVDPAKGALLHAAGTVLAGDLSEMLATDGFEVRRVRLYEAVAADRLSPATLAALDGETLDAALFFSPRTAATFVTLVVAAGRDRCCATIDAVSLSPAVADRLAGLPWRRIHVARHPDQAALLAALDAQAEP